MIHSGDRDGGSMIEKRNRRERREKQGENERERERATDTISLLCGPLPDL